MALWEHGPQFALCPVPIAFKLKHVLRAGRLTESADDSIFLDSKHTDMQ